MYKDIEQHISSCINCRTINPSRRKLYGHLHPIELPTGVCGHLAMDYVGSVPGSKSGNKYFIVSTDLFPKYVVTKAVPNDTLTIAAKFLLYDVFIIHGVTIELVTDNVWLIPMRNDICFRRNAEKIPSKHTCASYCEQVSKLLARDFDFVVLDQLFTFPLD